MTAPPIWLLDVDGVLNAVGVDLDDEYTRIRVQSAGVSYGIAYRPELTKRIAALHEQGKVEVRWLTTWCNDAADFLAPAIGLPSGLVVEGTRDHLTVQQGWWKSVSAQRVSDRNPERHLIWTDDDLTWSENRGDVDWLQHRTSPTLALSPNPSTGLTDWHMDMIEVFTAEVLAP